MKTKLTSLLAFLVALMVLLSACSGISGSSTESAPLYETATAATQSIETEAVQQSILDLAYGLAPGETLEEEAVLTGTVTKIVTLYS